MKWIMIGLLCAVYRLILEEQVLAGVHELREALHLVRTRRARAGPTPKTGPELFVAGFLAALIVLFWPLYLLIAVGKILGFTAAIKQEKRDA